MQAAVAAGRDTQRPRQELSTKTRKDSPRISEKVPVGAGVPGVGVSF